MQEHKKQHKNRLVEARAKTAEEERDSLRIALKLLMQDRASNSVAVANDRNEQGSRWKPVGRKSDKGDDIKKTDNQL